MKKNNTNILQRITFSFFFATVFMAMAQEDDLQTLPLNEVIVHASTDSTGLRDESDVRHGSYTVSVVTREEMDLRYQSSVLPVLNTQVPGFFSTARGFMGNGVSDGASGHLSIRGIGGAFQNGSSTTSVLVLIDGHPQYAGLMGHPVADAYQTMMIERVEVIRGPSSVIYGSNAMGGVINLVTRKSREEGVHTHVKVAAGSYGSFIAEADNRIRKGKFSSNLSLSYKRSDGHRPRMNFEQYNGYGKLNYEFNRHWKIWGETQLTHFYAENPGSLTKPYTDNDQKITRGTAAATLENKYRHTSGCLSLYYNWGHHWINDGYPNGGTPLDYRYVSDDGMLGVSAYQSYLFPFGTRLNVGMDYQHFGGKARNAYLDGRTPKILADKVIDDIAAYTTFRQNIHSWLSIDAGARFDYHSQAGGSFIPQAGMTFHLPDSIEIKATAGKGYRNPTLRELFMFPPQNSDLKPEEIWNYELAFSQIVSEKGLSYHLNVFYLQGKNLIMKMPNPNGSGWVNQNTGQVENFGAEAQMAWAVHKNWAVSANYSFLHMKNPVLAAPEHKLCAQVRYQKGPWMLSNEWQYIAGLYTELNPSRTEEFLLWNLQAHFRVNKNLSLFINGENLLSSDYEILSGYPMPKANLTGGLTISF